jgi:hypothetical protein
MKWRTGTLSVCPLCCKRRVDGETLWDYPFTDELKKVHTLPARKHIYRCGTEIIEAQRPYNGSEIYSHMVITKWCSAGSVVLSKAITYVANHYDLSTLSSIDLCDYMSDRAANITAKMISIAIRHIYKVQDKFRLPPIPCLESHMKAALEWKPK